MIYQCGVPAVSIIKRLFFYSGRVYRTREDQLLKVASNYRASNSGVVFIFLSTVQNRTYQKDRSAAESIGHRHSAVLTSFPATGARRLLLLLRHGARGSFNSAAAKISAPSNTGATGEGP